MSIVRGRAGAGVVLSTVALTALVAGELYSQVGNDCITDPTMVGVGQTSEVTVEEPSWLGVAVSSDSVYRLDVDGGDGTALEAWLGDYDSGVGNCYVATGQGPVAEAVVEGGSATLTWSGGGYALDLVRVTNPAGMSSQTLTVTPTRVAEPPGYVTWIVPAVAHTRGKFQSDFRSDVTLYNPRDYTTGVSLELKPTGGGPGATREVAIGPSGILRFDDIIASLFGSEGTGSLWISSDTYDVMIGSRTYTGSAGGTSGQFIAPQGWREAARVAPFGADDGRRLLLHLTGNDDFRSNVGFSELMGLDTAVGLQLLDASGSVVAEGSVAVPGGGHVQINDIFAYLGAPALDAAVLATQVAGFARVLSYASIVDNRSNDPIYVPAQRERDAAPYLAIAAAASGNGARGTRWRTDVRIFAVDRLTRLGWTFLPFDGGDAVTRTVDLEVPAGGHLSVDDVVASLGADGGGALLLTGSGTAGPADMLATSRTYNLSDSGTFGQFIPAGHGPGAAARSVVLGAVASTDYRTNIGLLNANTSQSLEVTVRLVSENDVLLGSGTASLAPLRSLQLNDIFRTLAALPAEIGRVEVATQSNSVGVVAYGSVVDNRSGDAMFVPADLVSYYPYHEPTLEVSNQANAVLLETLPAAVGVDPLPAGTFAATVNGTGDLGGPDLPAHVVCAFRGTDGRQRVVAAASGVEWDGVAGDHPIWCVIPEWGPTGDNSGSLSVRLTGGAADVSLNLDARANAARFDRMLAAVVAIRPKFEAYRLEVVGDLGGVSRPVYLLAMARRITSGQLAVEIVGDGDEVQDIRLDDQLLYAVVDLASAADNTGTSRLEPTCTTRTIRCGGTVAGFFNVSDCDPRLVGLPPYAERLLFDGAAGQRVSLLATVDEGAAWLAVVSPAGIRLATDQAPFGTPSSASIADLELPADGRYAIWTGASRFMDGVPYRVSLVCQSP